MGPRVAAVEGLLERSEHAKPPLEFHDAPLIRDPTRVARNRDRSTGRMIVIEMDEYQHDDMLHTHSGSNITHLGDVSTS